MTSDHKEKKVSHHAPCKSSSSLSMRERERERGHRNKAEENLPFGALKCNTFPSSLNMLTSSTPVIGCTFSFFSAPWSFLSSCAFAGFDLGTTFRRTVPFPPIKSSHAKKKKGVNRNDPLCEEEANAQHATQTQTQSKRTHIVLRKYKENTLERTDPVRGRLRLQLGQFCLIHFGSIFSVLSAE
jgi:hypothetical protein